MAKGIALPGKKDATLLAWTIRRLDPPKKIWVPLQLKASQSAIPCVEVGSKVRAGDKIAQPADETAVAVYSGVTGIVTAIDFFPHPVLGSAPAIEIESDPQDLKGIPAYPEVKGWENFSSNEIRNQFQDLGLVDLSTEEPLHLKTAHPVELLILNACEQEPYQTCDHALMMSHPLEVMRGAEILKKAIGAQRAVIAIFDNKLEVAETLKSKIFFMKWKNMEVEILPTLYPQGKDELLEKTLVEKFKSKSAAVFNIATAFAVFEAVAHQKPLMERVVTVTGECVIEPKNIWARIGMSFESVIKAGRGFLRQPRKLLMGGPMTGRTQTGLEVCVTKNTSMVLALPEELTKPENVDPCIRCARCVEACPVDLSPALITLAAEQDLFSLAKDYGAPTCIECGNCDYVCPSKRPMLELIRYSLSPSKKSSKNKRVNPRQKSELIKV